MNLSQFFHVVLIFYASHNTPNTLHFIVNNFMSTVYNESCFKRNQRVSLFIHNVSKCFSLNISGLPNPLSHVYYMCLHRAHHLEFHSISNKHALPRSDIRCTPNTTLSNQLNIALASISSKKLHPVSPLICCCCLPTPMTLASGGSPMFPLVVHQPASPSIWPAMQSLRRGLSTNPGATMWCVCGCS